MVKKQSFRSTMIRCHLLGMAIREGSPGWRAPIISMVLLTSLRSCSNLHLPDFFFITKMGVFQGDVEGTKCPASSCSFTKEWAASNFSLDKGHCSIHIGLLFFQLIGGEVTVALRINLNYPDQFYHPLCAVIPPTLICK